MRTPMASRRYCMAAFWHGLSCGVDNALCHIGGLAGVRVLLWLALCTSFFFPARTIHSIRATEVFAEQSQLIHPTHFLCGERTLCSFSTVPNSSGGSGLNPAGWRYDLGSLKVTNSGGAV